MKASGGTVETRVPRPLSPRKNLFALLPLTKDSRASGLTGLHVLHHGRRRASFPSDEQRR